MAEKLLMLALSPTMEKGTIVKWRKSEGDLIASGDVICEVETDKATMEYESVNEGTLLRLIVPAGEDVKVGDPIAIVGRPGEDISRVLEELKAATQGEEVPAAAAVGAVPEKTMGPAALRVPEGRFPDGVRASPIARELAERHGIDIRLIPGSGPDGRIVKRDVEAAVGSMATGARPPTGIAAETPFVEIPVSGKRRVIAKRLAESMYSAPHYYLKTVAAVDGLLKARKKLNEGRAEKVSLNAFLIRFAAEALRNHPAVNSSWRGETIARFQRADIGLAVAQPDGLITPIMRDCWNKGILAIEEELRTLIDRALKSALKPEEYTGATFTISNLGSYDVTEFTAIINPPGSAILAVGKAEKTPVVGEEGGAGVETRMALTLSCDHRVIDGVEGALFLKDLKGLIEYPVGPWY